MIFTREHHEREATHCFAVAEGLNARPERNETENAAMAAFATNAAHHAGFVSDKRLRVACYWLASRVCVDLDLSDAALAYAEAALCEAEELGEMFRGYAFEALSRALSSCGRLTDASEARASALSVAASMLRGGDEAKALHEEISAL